ncbi:unnamed protein product [Symbiodinium natans]|uniref:Uncharacterized protein n=1 Tax=Symbiodinium natans TaxID=878477 RepID=A0A812J3K5_9DINO|nr:unnamed protein product [Symbiodinium natans]
MLTRTAASRSSAVFWRTVAPGFCPGQGYAGCSGQRKRAAQTCTRTTAASSKASSKTWVFSVAWSGQLLAVGVQDRKVQVYDDEQDYSLVATLTGATNDIESMAWFGRLLAVGGKDSADLRRRAGLQPDQNSRKPALPCRVRGLVRAHTSTGAC